MSDERDAELAGWHGNVPLWLSSNGMESGLADEPGKLPEFVKFGGVAWAEIHCR